MPVFIARVYVTLKPGVNDPQGQTVMNGLHSLGYYQVTDLRVGKYLELRIAGDDRRATEIAVAGMCDRLLANPVIEEYRFTLEPTADPE